MKKLVFSVIVILVMIALLPMVTRAQISPPVLAYPQNGSEVDPVYNLRLGWHHVSGAQTYQYQFDRYSGFPQNPTSSNTGTLADTSVGVIFSDPNLAAGVWYWRVRAKDANSVWGGWSDVWTFNVVPGTPTAWLTNPKDGSSWTSSPFVAWQSNKLVDLQVATDVNFANLVINQTGLTGSAYQTNLASNTYYWRVRPQGGNWTPAWSFSVNLPPIPIPDIPTLTSPANGYSSTASPLLSWNPSVNATSYDMQVATDVNFVSLVINQTGLVNTNYQTNLSPNTYYWRVSATNSSGTSAYSGVRSFTVITTIPIPDVPVLSSPASGHASPNSPSLSWNPSANATSYDLEVTTDLNFANLVIQTGLVNTSYQTNLSPNTYFWRVRATNSSGTSAYSEIWGFLIGPLPDVPILSSPTDGYSSTANPLLSWNPSANATAYHLQVATDDSFSFVVINRAWMLTDTHFQTAGLTPNIYYWRVEGLSQIGTSSWSQARSFRIRPELVIVNPFTVPVLDNASPIFKRCLTNPPLFGGNVDTLVFTVSVSDSTICKASILNRDTLVITGIWSGQVTVTVVGTDKDGTTTSYTTPIQLITAVKEEKTPTEFALSQNYPNPFNPTTMINFQLPISKYVTLKIYDVLGKEIETLVDGEKSPGSYEVRFDASNLPSGVYLYILRVGEFVQTKKMILLK